MQIKSIYRNLILALTITLFIALNSKAQTHPKKPLVSATVLPLDPAVRTGKLANGFTYYIRHNEEPKNRVVFYLANKVGSVLETEDQQGLAHFMEHMSFKGTKHFPKHELIDYLQKSGVRFGADLNAYTSFDETIYQLPLPADPAIVKKGIQIMRDWAQDATLDSGEINSERGVVLEEKRLSKGAGERMEQIYMPLILNNSRYANRKPIGTDEVLNNFKPEAVRRFYHDWYRPDLQALIVVGDIDVNKMEQTIKEKFSDLKNPVNEKIRTRYSVPLTGKNQFIAVTDPEQTNTTVQVMIKQPELPLHTAEQYRESIVRQLFNTLLGERYSELQRKPDPLFLQGGAGISGLMGGLDNFTVSVVAKPGKLENGFKAIWREAERAARFGFTAPELERAKVSYLNNFESAIKEKDKTNSGSYVNEYLQFFLNGTASPGIDYEYQLVKKDIAGITVNDLNKLAKGVDKNTDRDILIMAPEKDKASLPDDKIFNGWIRAVDQENMTPYQEETSNKTLLATEPVPGKIISEKTDTQSGITTILLGNGVKVLLKTTDYRNDEVAFNGFAPGGTSLYSDADFQSASGANMIPSFGVGNYNTTQLDKYLSDKQLNVSPYIGERIQGISGGATNKDLQNALKMVYAYFTEPRKDSLQFQNIINGSKASIANRSDNPSSVFQDTVSAILSNNNIRRTGPTIEKINQIDLDKAYQIYKERFADASSFTFVFVGSINMATIKPLLERYLGSLPALHQVQEAKDLHIHIPEGVIEKTVYKGTEPKANVNLIFSGPFDYSYKNVLAMDALKETLQIRLIERLRIDESGVYSPSARFTAVKYPESRYSLSVSFGCAPKNADKLIASVLDEIAKLKADGPSQINLDKFKAEDQRVTETQVKTNGFWLNYLVGQLQDNEPLNQFNEYSTELKGITINDVKELAVKYLNGKNYIRLELMPDNKITN